MQYIKSIEYEIVLYVCNIWNLVLKKVDGKV